MDRRRFAFVLLGAALGSTPGPAAAAPSPADEALDQVQASYAKVVEIVIGASDNVNQFIFSAIDQPVEIKGAILVNHSPTWIV
jgi:hypothetical protein